MSKIKVLKSLD